MDQDLYLQNQVHPPTSFFDCFNCFSKPEPAECYLARQAIYLKNQKNKHIYPAAISQQAQRPEAFSSNNHSMLNSRTSIKNDNKRDTISLRRSKKVNIHYQHNILSQETPSLKQHVMKTGYPYTPHNLPLQTNNSNPLNFRLSVPQAIGSQVPTIILRRGTTKPSITFSYKLSLPNTTNNTSIMTSMVAKQLNENIPQINEFKQTDSVIGNSEASIGRELPSDQKLSQFCSSKERVESLQLQVKKVSDGSKESNNQKKRGSVGQGKLQFQIRQTISIKQPEEEDLHESIVLPDKNFTHHNGPFDNLLKPIRQSEPQLQSLIGSFGSNQRNH